MSRNLLLLVLVIAATVRADLGAAQGVFPLSFEGRGSMAFATGDFPTGATTAGGASSGWGVGVSAAYSFIPGLAIYAGLDRFTFGVSDDAQLPADAEFVDNGFVAGARARLPLPMAATPWVRGGALFRTLQVRGGGVDGGADPRSDRSPGFEVGGGVDIPLGMVLSFTPSVLYRSYRPEFGGEGERNVRYIDAGVGMRVRL
jgi:hypothetical protein